MPLPSEVVKWESNTGLVSMSVSEAKSVFCPEATDVEAYLFLKACASLALNPYLKEAYLIKYQQGRPAAMVIGFDAYLKALEAHPNYASHESGIVCLDKDGQKRRTPHEILSQGEKLVGGWCCIWKKDGQRQELELSLEGWQKTMRDRDTGQVRPMAKWAENPAFMIRKQAIKMCAKEALPDLFSSLVRKGTPFELPALEGEFLRLEDRDDVSLGRRGAKEARPAPPGAIHVPDGQASAPGGQTKSRFAPNPKDPPYVQVFDYANKTYDIKPAQVLERILGAKDWREAEQIGWTVERAMAAIDNARKEGKA